MRKLSKRAEMFGVSEFLNKVSSLFNKQEVANSLDGFAGYLQ